MLKQLKRKGILALACVISIFSMSVCAFAKPDWPLDTGCQSEAGIVMDLDSGAVLFAQNIHVQEYPASITKMPLWMSRLPFHMMLFITWSPEAATNCS